MKTNESAPAPAAASLLFPVPGDLLSTNAVELRSQLDAFLAAHEERKSVWEALELDLRRASMVDSVGLNFLVALHKRLHAEGKKLRIRTVSDSVQRILRFTRLDQYAEVVPS
ncbi:MAG: STAS domain-containing protein [Acidobacteriota bacterium]